MFRRSLLALAAVAAVGTAALTPTTASATWYGKGFYGSGYGDGYGKGYGYGKYYGGGYGYRPFYGKRFGFYGGQKFGYKRWY